MNSLYLVVWHALAAVTIENVVQVRCGLCLNCYLNACKVSEAFACGIRKTIDGFVVWLQQMHNSTYSSFFWLIWFTLWFEMFRLLCGGTRKEKCFDLRFTVFTSCARPISCLNTDKNWCGAKQIKCWMRIFSFLKCMVNAWFG